MNKTYRFFLLVLPAVVLAACARTPVPEVAPTDVPADWQGPVVEGAAVWPDIDWWRNFGSEELIEIIEEVQANNFDYANNVRNLRTAQIQLQEAGLQLWPTPGMSIGTNASTSVSQFEGGGSSSGGSSGPFNLSASLGFSGILSKPLNNERALNDYQSRLAQIANTAMNTMGTAASTYFQLLFLRDQIEATRMNLDVALEVLATTQARVDVGAEIPINLLNQEISVQNIRNQLTSQQQQDFSIRATLALLMGRSVQGFNVEGQTLEGIIVPTVQPGLPSELLRRRPDLVQAELSLRNAAINVDVARLAFFPSISMSGSAGASSPSLIDIVASPASTTVSLSASLSQQLLDNGGRKRSVEQARLSLESSLASYRSTVIRVFNDIEVQLNSIQLIRAQGEVARQNLISATEQERLATLRYNEGTATYQTSLNAQNSLFSSRNSVLSNNLQQINAIINFYQALGGGWEAGDVLLERPEYAQAR